MSKSIFLTAFRYGADAEIVRVALTKTTCTGQTSFIRSRKQVERPAIQLYRPYGERCWELDALSPVILRERVEAKIVSYGRGCWNRSIEVEAAERESMADI